MKFEEYYHRVMENTSVLISGQILNGSKMSIKNMLEIFANISCIWGDASSPNKFSKVSSNSKKSFLGSH